MSNSDYNRALSSKRHSKIVVFGGSGHTGQFVVSELERRGFEAVLAGRDREKLSRVANAHPSFEVRVASVGDARSLDRALDGCSLVINCAGPFVDTALPVIEAALRARIHYLDVTAEQRVALAAFEEFSERAKAAGVLILPSMGFFGGLGDLSPLLQWVIGKRRTRFNWPRHWIAGNQHLVPVSRARGIPAGDPSFRRRDCRSSMNHCAA